MKIKISRTDKLFSQYIRQRDKWKCIACGRNFSDNHGGLQCSHYWSRRHNSTRYDPENCDSLCFTCHQRWGGDYRDEYKAFKIKQLGEQGYKALEIRAHTYQKKDEKMAMIIIKMLLKEQKYA